MVELRTYKPKELGFTPYQIATELAKPIDYNGALSQLEEWNKLANSESVQAFNQAQAEEKQRTLDLQNAYDQEVQSKLEAGVDPTQIDQAEIYKTIGDTEKLLKISELRAKAAQEAPMKEVEARTKLAKLGALDPQGAMGLSQRLGIQGWTAPPQKTKEGGEPKEKKPEVLVNPDTREFKLKNADDGFLSPKDVEMIESLKASGFSKAGSTAQSAATPAPEPGPGIIAKIGDEGISFLSRLTGAQPTATPMASPTATPTRGSLPPPPPGFEYTGKVNANGDLGIRRVR